MQDVFEYAHLPIQIGSTFCQLARQNGFFFSLTTNKSVQASFFSAGFEQLCSEVATFPVPRVKLVSCENSTTDRQL